MNLLYQGKKIWNDISQPAKILWSAFITIGIIYSSLCGISYFFKLKIVIDCQNKIISLLSISIPLWLVFAIFLILLLFTHKRKYMTPPLNVKEPNLKDDFKDKMVIRDMDIYLVQCLRRIRIGAETNWYTMSSLPSDKLIMVMNEFLKTKEVPPPSEKVIEYMKRKKYLDLNGNFTEESELVECLLKLIKAQPKTGMF